MYAISKLLDLYHLPLNPWIEDNSNPKILAGAFIAADIKTKVQMSPPKNCIQDGANDASFLLQIESYDNIGVSSYSKQLLMQKVNVDKDFDAEENKYIDDENDETIEKAGSPLYKLQLTDGANFFDALLLESAKSLDILGNTKVLILPTFEVFDNIMLLEYSNYKILKGTEEIESIILKKCHK